MFTLSALNNNKDGEKPSNAVKKNKESRENFLALPFFKIIILII